MDSHIVSGKLIKGMHVPIVLQLGASTSVDFAAAYQLDLTLRVTGPGTSFQVGPSQWVWSNKTATSATATWQPAGSEFVSNGYCRFGGTLVADGCTIDLISFYEWVEDN